MLQVNESFLILLFYVISSSLYIYLWLFRFENWLEEGIYRAKFFVQHIYVVFINISTVNGRTTDISSVPFLLLSINVRWFKSDVFLHCIETRRTFKTMNASFQNIFNLDTVFQIDINVLHHCGAFWYRLKTPLKWSPRIYKRIAVHWYLRTLIFNRPQIRSTPLNEL